MYSFISGRVAETSDGCVTIENHGIGYELNVSAFTLSKCAVGNEISLYCHMNVKEDGVSLLGFADKTEKQMFLRLTSVSGVGPKVAFAALSGMRTPELALAIVTGDTASLSGIKGLGKKTAERIILELKEKVEALTAGLGVTAGGMRTAAAEAVEALSALGFSRTDAVLAVNNVADADKLKTEDIIMRALRSFNK
ncbi:MAG: Holliday junction branch migration protein RuvA [Clostridiales bacterium]|jgi:Holliday junction DNA helicase RuvA|nr:Holliday junction branch migration protein RuvA [Clostridiales bacterium]